MHLGFDMRVFSLRYGSLCIRMVFWEAWVSTVFRIGFLALALALALGLGIGGSSLLIPISSILIDLRTASGVCTRIVTR